MAATRAAIIIWLAIIPWWWMKKYKTRKVRTIVFAVSSPFDGERKIEFLVISRSGVNEYRVELPVELDFV